jgi:hypothetical protein
LEKICPSENILCHLSLLWMENIQVYCYKITEKHQHLQLHEHYILMKTQQHHDGMNEMQRSCFYEFA